MTNFNYTCNEDAFITDAMIIIEKNKSGTVFVLNSDQVVIGSATDGDIRRYIISGGSYNDRVVCCMNRDFVFLYQWESRERLLKFVDRNVLMVPILSKEGALLDIFRNDVPTAQAEKKVLVRSIAPARISLSGGGSDLTYYFYEHKGAVLNFSIAMYSRATLRIRSNQVISINSADLGLHQHFNSLDDLLAEEGELKLFAAIAKAVNPKFGFELHISSDFEVGTGLGGSAAVTAAILGCFNELRTDKWSSYELAEIAYQVERHFLGISGGWQDQYAAVFGGCNFMEFEQNDNIIQPLRIAETTLRELENSLILCNTGSTRASHDLHIDQRQSILAQNNKKHIKSSIAIAYMIRNLLLRGNVKAVGKKMHESWLEKRKFSDSISSKEIDDLYSGALKNGASGGKLLGAGGGGYFLFFVEPLSRNNLIKYLDTKGLCFHAVQFDRHGTVSWVVRD